jgi:hypothetical protein
MEVPCGGDTLRAHLHEVIITSVAPDLRECHRYLIRLLQHLIGFIIVASVSRTMQPRSGYRPRATRTAPGSRRTQGDCGTS